MSHKFARFDTDEHPPKRYSRCRCGHYVPPKRHLWEVEDAEREHLELVERVKATLDRRVPSLKGQRDYFQERADDPDESPQNRALWKQLADELTPRIKDRKPVEQETLFPMEVPVKGTGDRT